jgi:hypothetical protein
MQIIAPTMIIGGIQIFLQNSPTEANKSVSHEEVMQKESKKEAMEPNDFKSKMPMMQVQ